MKINGNDIKNLVTRFFYEEDELRFQIILHLGLNKSVFYQEFNDYLKYKKVFNELLSAKSENAAVVVPLFSGGEHAQDKRA